MRGQCGVLDRMPQSLLRLHKGHGKSLSFDAY